MCDKSVPANWEIGPCVMRRTEDVKKLYFASNLPTCSFGHRLAMHTMKELRWNVTGCERACRKCGKMQNYAVETCRRRCEFHGLCFECSGFWRDMEKVRREGEIMDKMQRLFQPKKKASLTSATRIDLIFPIFEPEKNPVSFIRFFLALNFSYADYIRKPWEIDSAIVQELGNLCSEADPTGPPDTRTQFAIMGVQDYQGLQCFFDVVMYHPKFFDLYERSRHFRPNFVSRSKKLRQEEDLMKLYTTVHGSLERQSIDVAGSTQLPPRRHDFNRV